MNKTKSKFNLKALLTLFTALVLSLTLCLAVACGGNSSESTSASDSESTSESTSEVKDTQKIANGNFEYNVSDSDKATVESPYTSGIKWSPRSSISPTKAKSGIIRTAEGEDGYRKDSLVKDGESEGKYVLMLKNDEKDGVGNSIYFTSSTTVTLEHGKDALLSVWVKTVGIEHQYSAKTGAYIQINNTIGTSIAPTVIDNIDTNGEWSEYKIYLRGSNFAVTKFQVVLGLGHGDKNNQGRLCEGTAYFDDVVYKVLGEDEGVKDIKYDDLAPDIITIKGYDYKKDETDDKSFIVDGTNKTIKVNFAKTLTDYTISGDPVQNFYNANKTEEDEKQYATNNGFTATVEGGKLKFDFTGKDDKNPEFGTSYTYTSAAKNLNAYDYANNNDNDSENDYKGVMITFKANVDVKKGSNGAFVKIIDTDNEKATDALTISTTDGEKRYAIYLTTNKTGVNYKLQITFGPTSASMENTDFPIGTAEFYDFKTTELTEWEFANAETTDAATLTLLGKYLNDNHDEDKDDTTEDSYSINTTEVMTDDALICLGNISGSTTYKESNLKAGLVNGNYDYPSYAGLKDALNKLESAYKSNPNNKNANKFVQAIALIKNDATKEGFISLNETNVPANSIYKFSVKLRVADGDAFVRLFDCGVKYGDDRKTAVFEKGEYYNGDEHIMKTVVGTNTTKDPDGYSVVTFIVKTGKNAKNYRLEVGFEGESGLALLGAADKGTSDSSYVDAEAVKSAFDSDFEFTAEEKDIARKKFYYRNEEDAASETNRIKETNESGKSTGEDKYIETEPTVVYLAGTTKPSKEGETAGELLHYYRYDTLETDGYVIETDGDDSSSSSSSSESSSTDSSALKSYVWLQIVSIVIAVVLIAVLVAIIIRSILKNKKSKITKTKSYYDETAPEHKKVGYDARKHSTKTSGGNKHNVVAPDDNTEYNYDETVNSDETVEEKETTETTETTELTEATGETETTETTENTDADKKD